MKKVDYCYCFAVLTFNCEMQFSVYIAVFVFCFLFFFYGRFSIMYVQDNCSFVSFAITLACWSSVTIVRGNEDSLISTSYIATLML